MDDWREQEATNQTSLREMIEWTEEANDRHSDLDRSSDAYLCECSDPGCTDPIDLTRLEYESIRSVATRFAIAVDHENPEIDRVVAENERYATVERFFGAAARIARDSDPRRTR